MSKTSAFSPSPISGSRPSSPPAGFTKDEDKQALMMGPLGSQPKEQAAAAPTPTSSEQGQS